MAGPTGCSEGNNRARRGGASTTRSGMCCASVPARERGAHRESERLVFERGLLSTFCEQKVRAAGEKFARQGGKKFATVTPGRNVAGACRKRLTFVSGRYAIINNGLGFQLIPLPPLPGDTDRAGGLRRG
ncbi:DUF3363 domain-containing protein [Gluconobacter thailandicus]|uniref:DUF3363 domain-containing protein n=1 Tax=Gluconobacter thailandicus TaxID=257438 RepID=UPI002D76A181|nr:DUF3363 domain-containing protein [Gluconobacter thailandicus]